MKKDMRLLAMLSFALFLPSCGGGSSSTSNSTTTNLIGSWTITATETGSSSTSVFTVTLVSSPCSVSTPIGTFTVQGPSCAIADDNSGQGSITGTGTFFYPPQGVLIGATASPAPNGTSIDLLFVEADQVGDAAVFGGVGTISNGTLSGNWACSAGSPICSGLTGAFSGTQQ
jgi:hypothetical protein